MSNGQTPPGVAGGVGGSPVGMPEGVLPPASRWMALMVAVVAGVAMVEAAYNLSEFVRSVLGLPQPLAVAFPVLAEAAAASFALQDLADRRRGHADRGLRVAAYVTLAASAVVNGVVGFDAAGRAGLLEVAPPVVLAAVIHLHGERAGRAWQSRAVLRPAWRHEQLVQAQVESTLEVLPLLAGDDVDGRATVGLLRRRLVSQTLSPAAALVAAGWHQRHQRSLTASQVRRLEIVAATVWGTDGPPVAPAATGSPRTSRPLSVASRPCDGGNRTQLDDGSSQQRGPRSSGSSPAPSRRGPSTGGTATACRSAGDDDLARLVAEARADRADAGEGTVRVLLAERGWTASAARIRAALKAADVSSLVEDPKADRTDATGPVLLDDLHHTDHDLQAVTS